MSVKAHTFELSNLGMAPFKIASCYTEDGKGTGCAYCGTHIKNVFIVESFDGKRFKVGSECVKKTGDNGLVNMAKKMLSDERARKRNEMRETARLVKEEKEREVNGGLTDQEILEQKIKAREEQYETTMREIANELAPYATILKDGKHGFRDSIAMGLYVPTLPCGGGYSIMLEILAKQAGRKNSEAYKAEYANVKNFMDSIKAKIEAAEETKRQAF